jgi:hypothetical protein
MHTVTEWPVTGWEEGSWRVVSVGQRALEFDTKGRPRPTNDFLRMIGDRVTRGVADVSRVELKTLLGREAVPTDIQRRGPIALRYGGDVVGRGAVTEAGLVSEIPKARAADLGRLLEADSD